jgi:hypothetical protein
VVARYFFGASGKIRCAMRCRSPTVPGSREDPGSNAPPDITIAALVGSFVNLRRQIDLAQSFPAAVIRWTTALQAPRTTGSTTRTVETVRHSAFVDYIRSAQDPQDGGFTLTLETIPQADWDFMESPSQLLPKHIGHERTTVALILSHCGRFGHGSRSSQVLEPRCIVYIPAKICEGDVRRRFVLRVSSVLERFGMIGFGSSLCCMSCTLLSRLAVTPQIPLKYVDIHLMSDRVTVCGRELSRPGRSVGSWEARNLAGRWLGVTLHNALRRPNPSRKRAGG